MPAEEVGETYFRDLPGKVRVVFFVFEAVVLEQIGVGQELLDDAERDRTGEGLRIRDGDREIQ